MNTLYLSCHRLPSSIGWLSLMLLLASLTQEQIASAAAKEQNGMILVPSRRVIVGTSDAERRDLAKRFDCHPTWLSDDLPQHEATVGDFWLDRFPVTNARYLAFVEATGHARPAWWKRWGGVFPTEYAEHPVVGLSAQDADAYAKWAGKRLPTAEEWEAAVAGAERGLFAWGDAWPVRKVATQVAQLKLSGDAAEWRAEFYDTTDGTLVETQTVRSATNLTAIRLPPFEGSIAFKLVSTRSNALPRTPAR